MRQRLSFLQTRGTIPLPIIYGVRQKNSPNPVNHTELLHEADRCVKCGICLPHCPTYKLTLDEGDSPRGRISLIQALANGHLSDAETHYHLDRCLSCLACESACPSGVNYGYLIDGTRALGKPGWKKRLIHRFISVQPYRNSSRLLLKLYRFSGLRHLLRLFGGKQLRRLDDLLPRAAEIGLWRKQYLPATEPRGRIGLFTGCVGRISDRKGLDASIKVLNCLGYEVVVPSIQGCCGALQQHAGEPETAKRMTAINQTAFSSDGLDAILYIASGCGAQLVKQSFGIPVFEITQFLNQCHWPDEARLNALPQTVGLHTPCTLKHQLKLADEPKRLLSRIPEIELISLDEIDCCGAAGSYLLEQPLMADNLRQKALDKILPHNNLAFLSTSNSGCALHLASGMRKIAANVQTVHPIELVAMSLDGTA